MNKIKLTSLQTRLVSGFTLSPLVAAAIIMGHGWFLAMVGLAAMLSLYEFSAMVSGKPNQNPHMAAGLAYFSFCFGSFVFLRFAFDQGAWLALCAILCVWASDIGAYMVGKTVGGPKMTPKLSPNKTWAGLGGAMFFCGLALIILQFGGEYLDGFLNTDLDLRPRHAFAVFIAGLFLGLVGQGGDLLESYYKRRAGVKDTGTLIPGHGGLLDRIDSLLLVVPVFLILSMLWL